MTAPTVLPDDELHRRFDALFRRRRNDWQALQIWGDGSLEAGLDGYYPAEDLRMIADWLDAHRSESDELKDQK